MKKLFRGIIAAILCAGILSTQAFAVGNGEESAAPIRREEESHVYLQDDMRAVYLTPETDFTAETDLSEFCTELIGLGMNAVVLYSSSENGNYFDLELDKNEGLLRDMIDAAHNANLSVYISLDVNNLVETVMESGGGLKEGFSAAAHKFVMKYTCEGILLTNYYTRNTPEMYAEYLRSGSGIGYVNWLYETNRYIVRTVSEAIRKTSNTTAAGIMIEDMWANASSKEGGSDTEDTTQAYFDGFSDTKSYVEGGLADFIMIKAYGSTEDYALNFEKVVSWWNELAKKSGTKSYICHLNERIGSRDGWNEDQLLRQLTVLDEHFAVLICSA